MEKKLLFFILVLCNSIWTVFLYAQQDNLPNSSVEEMRTGGRNAAMDAADITVYNPAGIVKLENGTYINLGDQLVLQNPSHEYTFPGMTEKKYSENEFNPVLPNLFAAYKKDKFGIFGGVYVSGGGGNLDYKNGSITTDQISLQMLYTPPPKGVMGVYGSTKDASFKGSSYYITPTIGVAYAVNNKFSVAGAIKYISADNSDELHLTLTNSPLSLPDKELSMKSTDKASGVGWVIGLNYCFNDNFNVAIHYEAQSNLSFKTKVNEDDFHYLTDGATSRRDLPAVLAIGVGYKITKKLSLVADFDYYFQTQADWGVDTVTKKNWSKIAGDVSKISVGLGYELSDKLKISGGLYYTIFNYDDISAYYRNMGEFEVVRNSNFNVGIGAEYRISKKFSVELAFDQTFWKKNNKIPENMPVTGEAYSVTTNNHVTIIGIGANVKL